MGITDTARQMILCFLFPPVIVHYDQCISAIAPLHKYRDDAGWDLFTLFPYDLEPNSFMDVRTGIRIDMPDEIWGRITGRSSTVRKWNLQVQEGIIDTGYTGELFIGVWNLTDEQIHVPRGTRLAQITFFRHCNAHLFAGKIREKDRGERGFGSTGKF